MPPRLAAAEEVHDSDLRGPVAEVHPDFALVGDMLAGVLSPSDALLLEEVDDERLETCAWSTTTSRFPRGLNRKTEPAGGSRERLTDSITGPVMELPTP